MLPRRDVARRLDSKSYTVLEAVKTGDTLRVRLLRLPINCTERHLLEAAVIRTALSTQLTLGMVTSEFCIRFSSPTVMANRRVIFYRIKGCSIALRPLVENSKTV